MLHKKVGTTYNNPKCMKFYIYKYLRRIYHIKTKTLATHSHGAYIKFILKRHLFKEESFNLELRTTQLFSS